MVFSVFKTAMFKKLHTVQFNFTLLHNFYVAVLATLPEDPGGLV